MKRTVLLLLCLLLSAAGARAQRIEFIRSYGPNGPSCEGKDVIILPDGNVLFVATLNQGGQEDVWLLKTNIAGDTLWTKVLGNSTRSERPESVILSSSYQLMIAGNSYTGTANPDALLMCLDTTGKLLWERSYGAAGQDFATVIKEVSDGFVMGGATSGSSTGNIDAWLIKTNATGDEQWSKTFGGAEYDDCWDLELTPEGGFMLTGGNYSFASGLYDDAWLIKTDGKGDLLWRKNYGVADRVDWAWNLHPVRMAGVVTGYVFTGIKETAETMPGAAYGNLHFVKVDLEGNVLWDKSIVADLYRKEGVDVLQLADGSFMISGYEFSSTARQLYLAHTDTGGTVLWDTAAGISQAYMPRALALGKDGSCYTVGSLATPAPTQHIFMAKIGAIPLGINEAFLAEKAISITPNPAKDHLLIRWPEHIKISAITLYDLAGRRLKVVPIAQPGTLRVDLGDIPAGPVVVSVQTGNGIETFTHQHLD